MTRPVDYLARYRVAVKRFDMAAMREIVVEMLALEELILPHPDHPDVVTICRSGEQRRLSNLLFFSDDKGDHRWCLVQAMNFIEAAVTESGVQLVGGKKETWETRSAAALFQQGVFDAQFERNDPFGGAILSSSRPFHFFYDQLLHLPELSDALSRRGVLAVGSCFADPTGHGDWRLQPAREDHYYLLPHPAGAFRLKHRLGDAGFEKLASEMERRVEAAAPEVLRPFAHEQTVLWVGITGQKRSWLEQVEGYAAIINAAAEVSSGLGVYIDGMTAPAGERSSVSEDERVVAAIRDLLRPEVQAVSLVGLDYATKIGHCRHVDAFIANGGTGCLVPLRFCRKPGVVHSNSGMRFFKGDRYENVAFVEDCHIREKGGKESSRTSYHIPWQHIHNLLARVLHAEGRPAPGLLSEPDVATLLPRE